MYSLIVIKGRVTPPLPICTPFVPPLRQSIPHSTFLPSLEDITALKDNVVVLVSRIIYKYINGLCTPQRLLLIT